MKRNFSWMAAALLITGLFLTACNANAPAAEKIDSEEQKTVTIEHLEGKEPTRATLSEDAAKRLDIQTAAVSDVAVNGTQQKVIPYSAILYDTEGNTWTYINPEPLVFVRHPITVDHIDGDKVVLSDGPDAGMQVVTVGAAELYGAEIEFEEE